MIDLSIGEWLQAAIAIATALAAGAAWYSVRVQLRALRESQTRDRADRRYHELASVLGRVGDVTGEISGRLRMYTRTGTADRTRALGDLGRISQLTAALMLHDAPDDVMASLLRFGEHLQTFSDHMPPSWWGPFLPDRWWFARHPIPDEDLWELEQLHLDLQRTARRHLHALTEVRDFSR